MQRDELLKLLHRSPTAVSRALQILYDRQTGDERAGGQTRHLNGQGFSATDASFGSSLARQVAGGRTLTRHQLVAARQMLGKYAGQLLASGADWARIADADASQRSNTTELRAMETLAAELLAHG